MELQARRHRRNVSQRFHRMDAGTVVAAPALPRRVPAAMLDMIDRMPPADVLGGLEEGEPPVQHAALAAVQIGTHRHQQGAVFAALDAGLQVHRRRVEQIVVVQPGACVHSGIHRGLLRCWEIRQYGNARRFAISRMR